MLDAFGANAELVAIRSAPGGTADEYGDVAAPSTTTSPVVWAGRAPAHLRRRRQRYANRSTGNTAGVDALVEVDELIVRRRDAAPFTHPGSALHGSVVEVDDHRTGTPVRVTFRVSAAELRAAGTIVDSLRLTLERLGEATG